MERDGLASHGLGRKQEVAIMRKKLELLATVGVTAAGTCALLKAAGAPPNVEGLMPFVLTLGIAAGPATGFANGAIARALFDCYQGWTGWWTLLTASAYGLVGLGAGLAHGVKTTWSRLELAALGAALTIVYDVVTMLAFGPLMGFSLATSIAGQIPFTINHLLSNTVLCFVLAPALLSLMQSHLQAVDAPSVVATPVPCKTTTQDQ